MRDVKGLISYTSKQARKLKDLQLFKTLKKEVVAGANGTQFIYLDSYAWEGSSGAGVFDSKGKYIGYVVAIDVGSTDFGVQVLNNVVLVIPAFKIDWTKTITEAE